MPGQFLALLLIHKHFISFLWLTTLLFHGHMLTLSGRGTPREDRRIVQMVQRNRRLSAVEVATKLPADGNGTVSPAIVRRRLHETDFNSRVARSKPLLTKDHISPTRLHTLESPSLPNRLNLLSSDQNHLLQ